MQLAYKKTPAGAAASRRRARRGKYKSYGFSEPEYLAMLAAQDGLCAICGRPETQVDTRQGTLRQMSVDHDHITGIVRALLCGQCNGMLGLSGDSADRLEQGARYLRRFQAPALSVTEPGPTPGGPW